MSFFIHQITIYHTEDNEIFTRMPFEQVYFRHNKKSNLIDKGFEKGSTGSITIPTTDKLNISTEDYVVEGIVNDEFDLLDFLLKVYDDEKNNIVKLKSISTLSEVSLQSTASDNLKSLSNNSLGDEIGKVSGE